MYAFKSLLVLALPLLAVAKPLAARTDPGSQTCNSGNLHCCNEIEKPTNSGVSYILGLLGILDDLDLSDLVGTQCTPITVIGTGSTGCSQQVACCSGNSYYGLITLSCDPINLDL